MQIARWILSLEGKAVTDVSVAAIAVSFIDSHLSGSIGNDTASLIATPLVGNNGKSEITVSRPLLFGSFPVLHTRKAVAKKLHVEHAFDYFGTNANDAVFEFGSDQVK